MSQSLAARVRAANEVVLADARLDRIGDYFTADYVAHVAGQDIARGRDAIRRTIGMVRSAVPDLAVDVAILVEGSDRVAWQRTLRGTQDGAYRGFPPTGRPMVWHEMVTSRFVEGLIAEEWVVTNLAERLLLARKR